VLLVAGPKSARNGKKVVRVQYVPESVRKEIRDQVKQEVLAQARSQNEPTTLPAWLNRFTFEGDIRLRQEVVGLAGDNSAPGQANFMGGNYTRAADAVVNTSNNLPSANTKDGYDRMRLRARVGPLPRSTMRCPPPWACPPAIQAWAAPAHPTTRPWGSTSITTPQ